MKNRLKKVMITIAAILLLAGGLVVYYYSCMDPHRGTIHQYESSKAMDEHLTKEEAIEDLQYVYQRVSERHPAWLDGNEAAVTAFNTQYELEKAELLKKESFSPLEVWKACASLTAVLRDGHTGVYYITSNPRFIDDVTQIGLYGIPIRIDGVAIEDIEKSFLSFYSYERQEYALSTFYSSFIDMDYWLAGCGVDISDGVVFTFLTPQGEQDYTYQFVSYDQIKGLSATEEVETEGGESEENKWVYYTIDQENDTALFTLTTCIYNDEYRETVDAFWKEVFDKEIHNVIVDLRGNGGGSSTVGDYFLGYLNIEEIKGWDYAERYGWFLYKKDDYVIKCPKRERAYDGKLYVLTDIYTYSSAMDFAMLVSDNGLGTIVGEASGNMPDGYGDTLDFQTPNAKLVMSISGKRWWRVDQSKSGQPIIPDVEVDGRDALEKTYELIQK